MLIREIAVKDAAAWEAMRCELWPDGDDHAEEIAAFFAGTLVEPEAVLVAEDGGLLIGFAELSARRDVAGLEGKLTGYVEGCLFVLRFADGMLPGGCWWLRGSGLVGVGV